MAAPKKLTPRTVMREMVGVQIRRQLLERAVRWIALNDNASDDHSGNPEAAANVAGYISTLLVADTFEVEPSEVARRVMMYRQVAYNRVLANRSTDPNRPKE